MRHVGETRRTLKVFWDSIGWAVSVVAGSGILALFLQAHSDEITDWLLAQTSSVPWLHLSVNLGRLLVWWAVFLVPGSIILTFTTSLKLVRAKQQIEELEKKNRGLEQTEHVATILKSIGHLEEDAPAAVASPPPSGPSPAIFSPAALPRGERAVVIESRPPGVYGQVRISPAKGTRWERPRLGLEQDTWQEEQLVITTDLSPLSANEPTYDERLADLDLDVWDFGVPMEEDGMFFIRGTSDAKLGDVLPLCFVLFLNETPDDPLIYLWDNKKKPPGYRLINPSEYLEQEIPQNDL